MIKAIVLDLDGVYYKKGGMLGLVNFLKSKNISENLIEEIFFTGKERSLAHLGQIQYEDFISYIIEKLDKKITKEELIKNYTIGESIDNELKDYIGILRAKGLTIGICSNTGELARESRKINNILIKIPEDADFAVYSYKVGLKKPDRKIFEIVVEKAKCLPEEIIYADDNPKTLPEAKDMGINTFLYENFNKFKEFVDSRL